MKLFHFGPSAHTVRPQHAGACHNCHAPVSAKFCGQCGQSAQVHVASAHEFIHHFVGHYVALEGKLWRTLGWLLAKPGALTLAFVRGQRGQFIDPLRLLLTVSLLVFLAMKWQVHQLPAPTPARSVTAAAPQAATAAQAEHGVDRRLFATFTRFSGDFAGNYAQYRAQPAAARDAQFWETWLRTGPTIMLCLIPLMALVLKLLHLGTGWRYGEHLVFSMHLQSVTLLALLAMVGGMTTVTKVAMLSGLGLYFLLALRKVYGGGWLIVALRMGVLGYLLTMGFEWMVRIAFLLRMT